MFVADECEKERDREKASNAKSERRGEKKSGGVSPKSKCISAVIVTASVVKDRAESTETTTEKINITAFNYNNNNITKKINSGRNNSNRTHFNNFHDKNFQALPVSNQSSSNNSNFLLLLHLHPKFIEYHEGGGGTAPTSPPKSLLQLLLLRQPTKPTTTTATPMQLAAIVATYALPPK
ncbi:Hypothetical predicted protein [Octopus vulgaris]|uniref:Uncharacterized protein n=1 Tax=Octopus vulgaris TaxID=6645 RepID=A0AA36ASQ1_OCTVU|nr:Hypothetical predicted protein [Octopus vulgaris]